jgi:hypothetical protein
MVTKRDPQKLRVVLLRIKGLLPRHKRYCRCSGGKAIDTAAIVKSGRAADAHQNTTGHLASHFLQEVSVLTSGLSSQKRAFDELCITPIFHSYMMASLMRLFHKPTDEKRMVVILPESRYADWLGWKSGGEGEFLTPYPADLLLAEPANGGH